MDKYEMHLFCIDMELRAQCQRSLKVEEFFMLIGNTMHFPFAFLLIVSDPNLKSLEKQNRMTNNHL